MNTELDLGMAIEQCVGEWGGGGEGVQKCHMGTSPHMSPQLINSRLAIAHSLLMWSSLQMSLNVF